MRLLLALMLLVSVAASLPSDEIHHVAAPAAIDLSHVDPAAPKAFAAQDGNLSMFGMTRIPNLGHYCTWAVNIDQNAEDPVGVPASLLNFSSEVPKNLSETSIGNATENITIINETMVWF